MEKYSIKKNNQLIGNIIIEFYKQEDKYIWKYKQNDIQQEIKIDAILNTDLCLDRLDYEMLSKDLNVKRKLQSVLKNGFYKFSIEGDEFITKKKFYTLEMILFLPLLKDKNEICLFNPVNLKYTLVDYIKYSQKTIITIPDQYIIKYINNEISIIKGLTSDVEIIKK